MIAYVRMYYLVTKAIPFSIGSSIHHTAVMNFFFFLFAIQLTVTVQYCTSDYSYIVCIQRTVRTLYTLYCTLYCTVLYCTEPYVCLRQIVLANRWEWKGERDSQDAAKHSKNGSVFSFWHHAAMLRYQKGQSLFGQYGRRQYSQFRSLFAKCFSPNHRKIVFSQGPETLKIFLGVPWFSRPSTVLFCKSSPHGKRLAICRVQYQLSNGNQLAKQLCIQNSFPVIVSLHYFDTAEALVIDYQIFS